MQGLLPRPVSQPPNRFPPSIRDYVKQMQAAAPAREKTEIDAAALVRLLPAITPLQQALRQAGQSDPDCARAGEMVLLARDLRSTGEVRADLSDQQVADVVWSTNGAEYFELLCQRGWSAEQHGEHLIGLWTRMLLEQPSLTAQS